MNKHHDFWLNLWTEQYIPFHDPVVNLDLQHNINKLHLNHNGTILVPLCGKTPDMLWLAKQGYQVIGVELSPIACHDFFAELDIEPNLTKQGHFICYDHDTITLLCGDFFDLSPEDLPTVHAVYDCKALIALPEKTRKKYVEHLLHCLGKNINILLFALESSYLVEGPPFPVEQKEIEALYSPYFNVIQLIHRRARMLEHLCELGYRDILETAYLISRK